MILHRVSANIILTQAGQLTWAQSVKFSSSKCWVSPGHQQEMRKIGLPDPGWKTLRDFGIRPGENRKTSLGCNALESTRLSIHFIPGKLFLEMWYNSRGIHKCHLEAGIATSDPWLLSNPITLSKDSIFVLVLHPVIFYNRVCQKIFVSISI